MPRTPDQIHSVTTARAPRSQDQRTRARQYFLAMGIRTACFVAACITASFTRGFLLWFFVVLAVILPYIAVVLANATNHTIGSIDPAGPDRRELTGPAQPGQIITITDDPHP